MSATSRQYAELYRRFQAPISKVYDCGKKCAPLNNGTPFCCDAENAIPIVEKSEYALLQSRSDLWKPFKPRDKQQANEVADLKGSDCRAVECKGAAHCERDNRSLACRSFPYYPYFNAQKELIGLAHYWSFEGSCWIIHNLTIVELPFIQQFVASHEYLFKTDPAWRDTYIGQSSTHRGVYSKRKKKFPVIARNGDYFWVLPNSGGEMVPAKKSELYELRAGFPGPEYK